LPAVVWPGVKRPAFLPQEDTPVLFEKSDRLGGNLIPGGVPDFKEDDIALVNWYAYQLETLGVDVRLNTRVDTDHILSGSYDAVLIATGSNPRIISLGDDDHVHTAEEVLFGKKNPGSRVVVAGGGLIGCELALWLAQQGRQVTIVEQMEKLLAVNGPLCHANSDMLEALIPHNGIKVHTGTRIQSFRDGKAVCTKPDNEVIIHCDSVVLAVGYAPDRSLYEEIRFQVPNTYVLGDARRVANIMYAIWDAFEVANGL
jgi:2-enoate reductase